MRILLILFLAVGTVAGCAPVVIVAGMGAAAYYSSMNDISSADAIEDSSTVDTKEKVVPSDSTKKSPEIAVKKNTVELIDKLPERKHGVKNLSLKQPQITKKKEVKISELKYDEANLVDNNNRSFLNKENSKTITKESLLGLDSSSLTSVLGNPTLLKSEPPGQVWLYKNRDCVMHVFLYEKKGNKKYIVNYIEANNAISRNKTSDECITSFALTYREKAKIAE